MIETQRLILRQWKESDVEPFITMGLDQHVMQFFPNLLTPQESHNLIQKFHLSLIKWLGLLGSRIKRNSSIYRVYWFT